MFLVIFVDHGNQLHDVAFIFKIVNQLKGIKNKIMENIQWEEVKLLGRLL